MLIPTVKGTLLNEAAKLLDEAMKLTSDRAPNPLLHANRVVGQPLPRVDGRLKVTGRATYAAEHQLVGVTHAVPVHSTIARGTITALATAAAEAVPGVRAVLTYQTAPRLHAPSAAYVSTQTNPLAGSTTTLPIMQRG